MATRCLTTLAALLILLGGLAGCAPEPSVSGEVTLDGVPLADGSIAYIPADGQGTSGGAKIANGKYTLQTSAGPKTVRIHSPKVIGKRPAYPGDPKSPMVDDLADLPPRYNTKTTLTYEVTAGSNVKNWELKSDKK
jgi:hypothetical protein